MKDVHYIPNIIICGDPDELISQAEYRAYRVTGLLSLKGSDYDFFLDGKLSVNDKTINFKDFYKIVTSEFVDYVVFCDFYQYRKFRIECWTKHDVFSSQFVTVEQFLTLPVQFYHDIIADKTLFDYLKIVNVRTMLDYDGYFNKTQLMNKFGNSTITIEGITDVTIPIKRNIYSRTFNNFSDISYRYYDAILVLKREWSYFEKLINTLKHNTNKVIVFAKHGSSFEEILTSHRDSLYSARMSVGVTGAWFLITLDKPANDFCYYCVTHKQFKNNDLPEGYQIIHAGKTESNDFGYPGDNTGNNISHLNVYLNEITALWWIWKNTDHDIIGICSYRRYLTAHKATKYSKDKILTKQQALKLLEKYDVLVSESYYSSFTQHEFLVIDNGDNLTDLCTLILRKYMLEAQPDYVNIFDKVMQSRLLYKCNLFVTRRVVFNAYCKWLFSFLLDATKEAITVGELADQEFKPRRVMGYLAERLLTTWLYKQNLRIKELKIMQSDE